MPVTCASLHFNHPTICDARHPIAANQYIGRLQTTVHDTILESTFQRHQCIDTKETHRMKILHPRSYIQYLEESVSQKLFLHNYIACAQFSPDPHADFARGSELHCHSAGKRLPHRADRRPMVRRQTFAEYWDAADLSKADPVCVAPIRVRGVIYDGKVLNSFTHGGLRLFGQDFHNNNTISPSALGNTATEVGVLVKLKLIRPNDPGSSRRKDRVRHEGA
jgi:hypothetical protein